MASSSMNLRTKQRISYFEPEEPSFDEYVYCDECTDFVYEYCAIHGPLLVIPDDKVPAVSPYPSFVPLAALTIPRVFLHLARSNIPGAGIGVFTSLALPRGVRFGPYRGHRTASADSAYCWQIYDRNNKPSHVVDAVDANRSNWMRYVNCARGWPEQNLVAYQYQGQLYYRTVKIIPRHTELLVFYGGEFARSLRVDLRAYNAPPLYAPRIGPPKKKPRFEPPSKKTEEDTTNTKSKTQEAPSEELSADAPATAKNEDPKKPETSKGKKRKAKSKPTDAVTAKKCPIAQAEKPKDQVLVISEKGKKNNKLSTKNKPKTITPKKLKSQRTPKAIVIANSKIAKTPKTSQSDNTTLADDNNNFICNDCENRFDTKQSLIQHLISSHNSVKDVYFRCKQCPYNTISKEAIKNHMRFHDNKRKYVCDICNYRFATNSNLKSHLETKHSSIIHSCDICEYTTDVLNNLDTHLRKHASVVDAQEPNASNTVLFKSTVNEEDKPFNCNVCNYRSKTNVCLKQHMKTHTNEKAYACNICDYKCNFICNLKDHMRKHIGDYYTCHLCSYKTTLSGSLKKHMRTHTGEKPFACNLCSYKANQSSNLKRHMRTHTGEKPFACNSCSYKATQSICLKGHMRTHTGEKPFACKSCPYKATQRSSLKRHMRTHT